MKEFRVFHDFGMVNKSEVELFARDNNIKIPSLYIDLISKHDGVQPEINFFYFNYDGNRVCRDITFFGFGYQLRNSNKIQYNQEEECGWQGVIIFGRSANGDYICFDYRDDPKTDNPPIVLMFHDDFDDDDRMITVNISENFEIFMDNLTEIEE